MSGAATAAGSDTQARAQVAALSERGVDAVAPLIAMLADSSWSVRREVVQALAALGDSAAEALCTTLRTQRDSEARIAATVDALVACRGERVEAQVVALAGDADPHVAADVAQILGRRRSRNTSAALVMLTQHADDNVAVGAIEALGRLGGRAAVDALIASVRSANFFRIFPAIDVLGRSGDPRAVAPLAELLRDSRYATEAARALGRTADRRAIQPLSTLLLSPSISHVRVAGLSLVELCERHAQLYGSAHALEESLHLLLTDPLVRRLVQSLTGADKQEKASICRLFAYARSEAATPALLDLLGAEPEVAESAGQALVVLGSGAEREFAEALKHAGSRSRKTLLPLVTQQQSIEALLSCLADESSDVRVLACDALARVGGVSAVPLLFGLLGDANQRVVYAAVTAIHALGTAETEGLAHQAAQSSHFGTRRAALRVLAYFGYESAFPTFVAALVGNEPRLRDIALEGLALLEQPEAQQQIVAFAQSSDAAARAAAVRALRHTSGDATVLACLRNALSDADPWVRYYACQALGKLGVASADAEIAILLGDAAGHVRVSAIEALSHLGTEVARTALRQLSTAADLDLQRAALVGLGLARDRASLPVLMRASLASDAATQLVAMASLAALDAPEVVTTLAEIATYQEESVRSAAINLLAERPTREAADALVALLLREGERSPFHAALARPRPGLVPALLAVLPHVDDDDALSITACLARLRTEEASAALFQSLLSPNPAARRAAASAVAALGTAEAQAALTEVSRTDEDPDVQRICKLYLDA